MEESKKQQDKLQKAILEKTSYMSTSKWMYLFSLIRSLDAPYTAKVKLLLDDKTRSFSIPMPNDFINKKYLEMSWGVFELKEIEWLLIPAQRIEE